MDKIFKNASVKRHIRAISSKSEAHRALICAALADKETRLICTDLNADIEATAACLCALGATVERIEDGFLVTPIKGVTEGAALDCNESGSTLRFMLPLCASLGVDCSFLMRGRLASRPLSPLYELLEENGVRMSEMGVSPLKMRGRLPSGNYSLAANVSSQYISGMLFALSVAEGESTLTLTGRVESAPYIMMTLDTLSMFGADIRFDLERNIFYVNGRLRLVSPSYFEVRGDWSNAAFFLAAGAIGSHPVTLSNLDLKSRQGDRAMLSVLREMGAEIDIGDGEITVRPSRLCGVSVDAADIPDLVPILSVVASVAEGETRIYNASRLRLKESDRIESVCRMLSSLGADIRATEDGMVIRGSEKLTGGTVDSFNDHRIAMSAAVASLVCENEVKIEGFEAINKSYPSFLDGWESEV